MIECAEHHSKTPVCLTRPPYRNGKKLRAVKVYTIVQESKYLLIQRLPAIVGALEQLLPYLNQYGLIKEVTRLDHYQSKDHEQFVETCLVQFDQIDQARRCKFYFDDRNFLGSNLHICYAPECETIDDLRDKIRERRLIVHRKAQLNRKRRTTLPTTNEIRAKFRELVQKSNLIPLVLQQETKPKRKRLQI